MHSSRFALRSWFVGLFIVLSGVAQAKAVGTLLVVGDSLSAEYGLQRGTGWVAHVSAKLREIHPDVTVVNASISGDTTSGGRARLAPLLTAHKPKWVILELGANDALRGLSLKAMRANLVAMIQAAQGVNAKVLVVGVQVPPNYGAKYTQEFEASFKTVANETGAGLVPFLLRGVADVPDAMRWFQDDRIHPNEAAQPLLADNVWPTLQKMF